MRICGIVAEYNPFHNGHLYHIQRTREALGQDCAVVCCMSGNFVQRGEPALLPKHIRASVAVELGIDLVLELPCMYALQSAEGFASSAVYILSSLGVLTDLSFGAECGDIDLLRHIAAVLSEHETVQKTLHLLKTGISYAAARERALYSQIKEQAGIISNPNNILAIEYLKALLKQGSDISPMAVLRFGAEHDGEESDGFFASASHIRRLARSLMLSDFKGLMPRESFDAFSHAAAHGLSLTDMSRFESAAASQLIRLTPKELSSLPDCAEGIEHRLYQAIRRFRGFDAVCQGAKTKRYALSRIRRMLICAFLGITAQDSLYPPPYARVLAFSDRGREVLRLAQEHTAIPLITKPAHVKQLSPRAIAVFEKEAQATDIYNACLPSWKDFSSGADWQSGAQYVRTAL